MSDRMVQEEVYGVYLCKATMSTPQFNAGYLILSLPTLCS